MSERKEVHFNRNGQKYFVYMPLTKLEPTNTQFYQVQDYWKTKAYNWCTVQKESYLNLA